MRTYSEAEVASIIERAVERQRAVEAGVGEAGLTLDEIERIGREAGIDPAHLRAAAAEVDDLGRTLARQSGQTRTEVYVERWLDTPFALDGWEDAVSHLRMTFGAPMGAPFGETASESVQQVGRSFEWSHTNSLGVRTRVVVSPRGDRTRLRITQLVGLSSPTVEGLFYGAAIALLLAMVAGGIGGEASGAGSMGAVIGVVTFLVAWAVAAPLVAAADRRWRARKHADLGTLADDLTPLLHGSQARDVEPVGEAAAPLGRLDLDALDDDLPATEETGVARRRIRG